MKVGVPETGFHLKIQLCTCPPTHIGKRALGLDIVLIYILTNAELSKCLVEACGVGFVDRVPLLVQYLAATSHHELTALILM
jgi:hypothetical protein